MIVDVVYYVWFGLLLDCEVCKCGNLLYFFDCVVLMLLDWLLGDLCFLYEGVLCVCMVVEMWIDVNGNKIGYCFVCGLMKFVVFFVYEEV